MELVEVIEQTRETMLASLEAVTLYLSVVSGYLIAAYTAGKNLEGFRMLLVTLLFLAFSIFFTIGTYTFLVLANGMYSEWGPDAYDGSITFYAYWISGAQVLGILGSLYFMYSTHKAGADT